MEPAEPASVPTATLLIDQARAFVQTEETRFAAAQTRATTLLVVAGVLAGIGTGMVTGLSAREYPSTTVGGNELPILYWAVRVLGLLSIGTLVGSAAIALGALKKEPESRRKAGELDHYLNNDALPLLSKAVPSAITSLFTLLDGQRAHLRESTRAVERGFKSAARLLGIAVASGLAMSFLIVAGSTEKPQDFRLVKTVKAQSKSAVHHATLRQR